MDNQNEPTPIYRVYSEKKPLKLKPVVHIDLPLDQFESLIVANDYAGLRKKLVESLEGAQSNFLWMSVTSNLSEKNQKLLDTSGMNDLMEEHFGELVSNSIDSLIDTVNDILRKKIILLQTLPENLDQYKNSYILVNNSQLYYLNAQGELKPIEILQRETFMAALDEQRNDSNIIDNLRESLLFDGNISPHDLRDEIIKLKLEIDVKFDFKNRDEYSIEVVNSGKGFEAEQLNRLNNLEEYVFTKKASEKTRGRNLEHLGGRSRGLAGLINACCFDTDKNRHVRRLHHNIVFSNDARGHASIKITMPVVKNPSLSDFRDLTTPASTTTEELSTIGSSKYRPLSTTTEGRSSTADLFKSRPLLTTIEEPSTTESFKYKLSVSIGDTDDADRLATHENDSPIVVPPKKHP